MDRLLTLEIFARLGETLSFSRTAEGLSLPRSSVSAAVRELEARVGTRLVNRTTRKVALTADGAAYLDWCQRLLADIEETETRMRAEADVISGRLRVEGPGRLARRIVCPALPSFLARHPGLALEMGVSDRTVDLVAAGIDCAIRVGALGDSSLVARPIGPIRMGSFASSGYLSAYGSPRSLGDLAEHRLVRYAGTRIDTSAPRFWYARDGEEHGVEMRASVTVDDAESYIACCRAGLGIVQVPAYDVLDLVRIGELVEVLADSAPLPMPMAAVFPERRYTPSRVHTFVAWIEELYEAHVRDG